MAVLVDRLPKTNSAGMVADVSELANLLTVTLGGKSRRIRYLSKVRDCICSSWVLSSEKIQEIGVVESAPAHLHDQLAMANYLMKMVRGGRAKYYPEHPPTSSSRKGWEVRVRNYMGRRFVIVIAIWVLGT